MAQIQLKNHNNMQYNTIEFNYIEDRNRFKSHADKSLGVINHGRGAGEVLR